MRFFKQLKYDLIYGNFKNRAFIKYIIWCAYLLFICFEIRGNVLIYRAEGFTVGDSLYYLFAGVRSESTMLGGYPYMWLLILILILFFTLSYTCDDLTGYGQQMILRSQKRIYWYLSKCIWNVSHVLVFYLVLWVFVITFTVIIGGELGFELTPFADEIKITGGKKPSEVGILIMEMVILPPLITAAMSILQMGLSLLFKPMVAFIFSSIMLIASADRLSPFLVGNYAMAIRSSKIIENGVKAEDGILAAVIMTAIGLIIGILAIRRYNILSKE